MPVEQGVIESLRRKFGFTDEDLNINRGGKLSPKQMHFLRNRAIWIAVVFTLLGLLLLIPAFRVLQNSEQFELDLGYLWLGLIGVVLLVFAFYESREHYLDSVGKAEKITGQLHTYTYTYQVRRSFSHVDHSRGYKLRVIIDGDFHNMNSPIFHIQKDIHEACLENNHEYTIYYTPRTMTFLSVKPAGESDE